MQRIHSVDMWTHIEDKGAMNFAGQGRRRLRLDVNAPDAVRLYYVDGDGETTFLARVIGRDVIEFQTGPGDFSIIVDGGELWAYTVDGEDLSFEIPDAVSLTRVLERRQRNPELEMMQAMMRANIEQRDRQQKAERDELVGLLYRQQETFKAEIAKLNAGGPVPADRTEPPAAGTDAGAGDAPAGDGSGGAAPAGGAAKK